MARWPVRATTCPSVLTGWHGCSMFLRPENVSPGNSLKTWLPSCLLPHLQRPVEDMLRRPLSTWRSGSWRMGLPVVAEGPWHQNGYRWILNPCPWNSAHTNRSAFIVRFTYGAIAAGCHHNGCTGKTGTPCGISTSPAGRLAHHLPRSMSVAVIALPRQSALLPR